MVRKGMRGPSLTSDGHPLVHTKGKEWSQSSDTCLSRDQTLCTALTAEEGEEIAALEENG